ncbi:WD40 repeat-like protein [Lentinus tigrinus ALCF2SS1-6]|uniref:WD40 repeat-like protein n=1 Tax=Lentinus tigrinus ALCF2SS1-6 TaxID=1328759 RepID=A0A5C2T1G1_9APHY|nr:WD40 repeat-like protein [Lentinus tigrinus ALCF2SS1-6]
MSATPEATISIPSPVSALSLGPNDTLCVGSEDGSLRWYNLPSARVVKAAKSLGAEIASITWQLSKKNEPVAIWIACGRRVICLPADLQKMIATADDASASLEVGEDDDDVLNELSISENGRHLAFTSDSGSVGTIDLASHVITRMKSRHNTVCGSVKFIPDRPSELVSGGYDSALLHFDVGQGTILSRFDISAPPPSEGVSLSPPFVLSVTVSSTGLLAAGTADGRAWIGGGGEKRPSSKKKRSRKWEGLKEDEGIWLQVADGPVVSSAFTASDRLFTCSLLGTIAEYKVIRDDDGSLRATKGWSAVAPTLEKVNAMTASHSWVVIGGFGKDGRGIVQVFHVT